MRGVIAFGILVLLMVSSTACTVGPSQRDADRREAEYNASKDIEQYRDYRQRYGHEHPDRID
jgi:hypothetical protein